MHAVDSLVDSLTVAELAERTGVPVRTVRFYQTQGLLPPPERAGREVRYEQLHLDRLHLIADLRDRGFQLSAIREILAHSGDDPTSLAAWLGLGETLVRPWTEDRPALLTESELAARVGGRVSIDDLVRFDLVERRTDTSPVTYLVSSPAMLEVGLRLADLGIPTDVAVTARRLLHSRLGRLADDLVSHITDHVSLERLRSEGPQAVATLVDELRPLAQRAASVVFAHEMERALRDLAHSGSEAQPRRARQKR
jgi:DNA-binding transcriptional MerR regulator